MSYAVTVLIIGPNMQDFARVVKRTFSNFKCQLLGLMSYAVTVLIIVGFYGTSLV
jgi:hypothetical protein